MAQVITKLKQKKRLRLFLTSVFNILQDYSYCELTQH